MKHTHNDILMPLAITVIIDQKVKDPEKQAFIEQSRALLELFDLPPMTADELLAWYNSHEPELSEKLTGKRRNTTVLRALSRFEKDIFVENIYEAMIAISVSDQEYVKDESDLIRSAAAIWGFRKPPIKVDKK